MTIAATVEWEVRTTGNNENGTGFNTAAAGTDYTDQDTPQLDLTDLATSGIGVTTLTSVTGGFTTEMIGNLIYIRSGTNVTVGYYEITARTDTNTVTLDRAPDDGVGGISSGSGKVGGAAASMANLQSEVVSLNKIWLKKGTYTDQWVFAQAHLTVEGYNATRGDAPTGADRPEQDRSSGAGDGISMTANSRQIKLRHLIVTNSGGHGINGAGHHWVVVNVTSRNNGSAGFNSSTNNTSSMVISCEFYGNSGTGAVLALGGPDTIALYCVSRDNTGRGIDLNTQGGVTAVGNLCYANADDGITLRSNSDEGSILSNTCDANTGASTDGLSSTATDDVFIMNNIFSNNGRYGANYGDESGWADYNNYFNNATAPRNNVMVGVNDKALDPQFTDVAGDDYSVGENMKAKGFPGTWPNTPTTGFMDLGAIQRAAGGAASPLQKLASPLVMPQ